MRVPGATYRLQFHRGVGFEQARRLVPYLHDLGVTDLYASPVLKARSGSAHGYDVTDPTRLDPELGTREEFESLAAELRHRDMGLLLDVVPNHMAMSHENPWWMDVLEHGRASRYAPFFDIDWAAPALEGKVLVPVLGGPYGEVMERGEVSLALEEGALRIRYRDHRFPVDPATYGMVLRGVPEELAGRLGPEHPAVRSIGALVRATGRVPPRRLTGARSVQRRARTGEAVKARLRELVEGPAEGRRFVIERIRAWGGDPSVEANRERLDRLLSEQAYLLSYWRAAAHEIDYRRFFDVSELVSLRMQDPAVFEATHALVLELVRAGLVTGLRIDHVDGLHDPQGYLERLQASLGPRRRGPVGFVVVEKILAEGEDLRKEWPVAGTTGYDFLEAVNRVLAEPAGVRALGSVYATWTGEQTNFPTVALAQKKKVMQQLFESEVGALALRLQQLARKDPRGRDLTQADLATALVEVTAALPVYRTYLRRKEVPAEDRRVIERAAAVAAERLPAGAGSALAFLRRVLLFERPGPMARQWLEFVMRWQQFTGPVTAKGVEDTAMYVHNRLLSRNDVGTDPGVDGWSAGEFHRGIRARSRRWPHTMNGTSTHDTKRSEDVRARLNVLSEIPDEWQSAVARFARMNASKRGEAGGFPVPDPNEEWLIYQTLLGAWPLDRREERGFPDRMAEYVRKALREAKVHSSWIDPDEDYEGAVEKFVRAVMRDPRFRRAFAPLRDKAALHGALKGMSQAVVKLAGPGVPDLYQGTEVWTLSLVDPDNRRPVDFDLRARLLRELDRRHLEPEELLDGWEDGRVKLWITRRALRFRRDNLELFTGGVLVPLTVTGPGRTHVLAFARRRRRSWAVVVAPVRTVALGSKAPTGEGVWGTTAVTLPASAPTSWTDALTGDAVGTVPSSRGPRLLVGQALARLPVALLSGGRASVAEEPGAVR